MAIADVVGRVYAARAVEELYRTNKWLQVVDDRSAEVMQMGDRLIAAEVDTTISIGDYSKSATLTYQDLDATAHTLNLNQKKIAAFKIDDIEEKQTVVSLMSRGTIKVARQWNVTLNDFLRGTYDSAVPNGNTESIAVKTAGASGNVAKIGNADGRLLLHEKMVDVVTDLRAKGWDQHGMMFVVIPPRVEAALLKYLTVDKPQLGAGGTVDNAYMNANLSRVYGCDVICDGGIPGSDSSAGADQYKCYFGIKGVSLSYAQQISNPERLRAIDFVGDLFRHQWVYGAAVFQDEFTYELNFDVS